MIYLKKTLKRKKTTNPQKENELTSGKLRYRLRKEQEKDGQRQMKEYKG